MQYMKTHALSSENFAENEKDDYNKIIMLCKQAAQSQQKIVQK